MLINQGQQIVEEFYLDTRHIQVIGQPYPRDDQTEVPEKPYSDDSQYESFSVWVDEVPILTKLDTQPERELVYKEFAIWGRNPMLTRLHELDVATGRTKLHYLFDWVVSGTITREQFVYLSAYVYRLRYRLPSEITLPNVRLSYPELVTNDITKVQPMCWQHDHRVVEKGSPTATEPEK